MLHSSDTYKNTSLEDRKLVLQIAYLLEEAGQLSLKKGKDIGMSFHCHSICRALAKKFPDRLTVVDGAYVSMIVHTDDDQKREWKGVECTHSWLTTSNGSLLDPYPVGMYTYTPLLHVSDGEYRMYCRGHYIPSKKTTAEIAGRSLWRETEVILRFINQVPPSIYNF